MISSNVIITVLLFLVIFGLVVMSHEFGHFIIAKRNGIRVIEFCVGMGPTLFSFRKGETKYSLNLLPLGGACMFDGEDGLEAKEGVQDEHSFPAANVWSRIATIFAGPFFNFLLAYMLALIIVAFTGAELPVIRNIDENSAAEDAGLKTGDEILRVNGERILLYREISLITALNRGEDMEFEYVRDGVKGQVSVTPRYSSEYGGYDIGLPELGKYVDCNPLQVFQYGLYEVRYWARTTYKSILMLLRGQATKDDVAGPIGVAKIVGDTYEMVRPYGISSVVLTMLNLVVLLSVNLGILNLLPLPALDGGRLVFLFIEVIRGKPVSPEKEGMVHLAGLVAFMILMVFVMYNDIMRIFR